MASIWSAVKSPSIKNNRAARTSRIDDAPSAWQRLRTRAPSRSSTRGAGWISISQSVNLLTIRLRGLQKLFQRDKIAVLERAAETRQRPIVPRQTVENLLSISEQNGCPQSGISRGDARRVAKSARRQVPVSRRKRSRQRRRNHVRQV